MPLVSNEGNDVQYHQLVHDLKSPVNSLRAIVQYASSQTEELEAKECLALMNQYVNEIDEKVKSTLNLLSKQDI